MDELRAQPRCVCEPQAGLKPNMSTVSKHLSVLKNAGVVQDEKRGVHVYYRLRCPCVVNFFECAEKAPMTNARAHARAAGLAGRGRRA